MKIKWYGHSCFMIRNDAGTVIVTDPCDPGTGYVLPELEADILTVSHSHHDHSYTEAVDARVAISEPGSYEVSGVKITGIESFHDDVGGKKRGKNVVFKFETDNLSVVHAGDLGAFDETLAREIGKTDVLLVPIGGVYTITAEQARAFANMLGARVVIPMHYKTPALTFNLADVNEFIKKAKDCSIHDLRQSEATVDAACLGTDRILILDYEK